MSVPDSDIVVDTLGCSMLPGWRPRSLVTRGVLAVRMTTCVALVCSCAVGIVGGRAAKDRRMPPCTV